jgi:hypothetical protein
MIQLPHQGAEADLPKPIQEFFAREDLEATPDADGWRIAVRGKTIWVSTELLNDALVAIEHIMFRLALCPTPSSASTR